jgi:hypothetical protein
MNSVLCNPLNEVLLSVCLTVLILPSLNTYISIVGTSRLTFITSKLSIKSMPVNCELAVISNTNMALV